MHSNFKDRYRPAAVGSCSKSPLEDGWSTLLQSHYRTHQLVVMPQMLRKQKLRPAWWWWWWWWWACGNVKFHLFNNDEGTLTKFPVDLLLWNDNLTRRSFLCVCNGMIQNADGTNNLQDRIVGMQSNKRIMVRCINKHQWTYADRSATFKWNKWVKLMKLISVKEICFSHSPHFCLAASVSWCWSWEKEGRAVEVVPGI